MPDNDQKNDTTLQTDDTKNETKNSLTTDADADNSTKDGPHQGQRDIGGYVPTN